MQLAGQKYQTLQDAITVLQGTTGFKTVKVKVLSLSTNKLADARLAITLNGHKQLFVVGVKNTDRRVAVAQI